MAERSTPTQPTIASLRRRAAVACRLCNARKVRCNVATAGRPCANCASDGVECELQPRKGRRRARVSSSERQYTPTSDDGARIRHTLDLQANSHGRNFSSSRPASNQAPAPSSAYPQDPTISGENRLPRASSDTEALPAALDFSDALGKERESYFYSGPHQRGTLDQATDDPNRAHLPAARYLVSYPTEQSKAEEDVTFLRAKGVFTLPGPKVYDQLVLSFFHYVFPLVPVVDAKDFLEDYSTRGYDAPSVLLLWSMFVAATNHVGVEVIQEAGYGSRAAMKKGFFDKAKIAYDQAIEDDPIKILQSLVILGFGVLNLQDQFDDWHWLGIAISMCFNLRMHRFSYPPTGANDTSKKIAQYHLCNRIWWSCVVRDRFLALVRSRPVRINLQDSDISLPEGLEELTNEIQAIPEELRLKYLPFESFQLGNMWRRYVRSGVVLEKIMRLRAKRTAADAVSGIEKDLNAIGPRYTMDENSALCQRVIDLELRLVHGALTILLHQPVVLKTALGSQQASLDFQTNPAIERSSEAASAMDMAIQEFIRLDLFRKMMPIFVTMLIPAMQTHLLTSRSAKPAQSRLGNHNLDLYMMALSELKEDYWGAELAFQIFDRARSKSHKPHSAPANTVSAAQMSEASSPPAPHLTNLTPVSLNEPPLNEPPDIPFPDFEWDQSNAIFTSLFDNFELDNFVRDGWADV